MSPLAFIQCIAYAAATGELRAVYMSTCFSGTRCSSVGASAVENGSRNGRDGDLRFGPVDVAILVVNGLLAFGLNYVSFTANRKAGALSMTVAGMFVHWIYLF